MDRNEDVNTTVPEGGAVALKKEEFPFWRILLWSLGGVGSTIIGSLTGLMTYFYVPPETSQAAFPQYLSNETILGFTLVGLIGYIGGLVAIVYNPFVSTRSDRSKSRVGRRKVFMLVAFLPVSVFSYLMFSPPVDHVSPANAIWLFAIIVLPTFFAQPTVFPAHWFRSSARLVRLSCVSAHLVLSAGCWATSSAHN